MIRILFFYLLLTSIFNGVIFSQAPIDSISNSISDLGFENVTVLDLNDKILISYENNLYRFEAKGLVRILALVSEYDLSNYNNLVLLLRSSDIPIVSVTLNLSDLYSFYDSKIEASIFTSELLFSFDVSNWEKLVQTDISENSSFFKLDIPVRLAMDYALGDFDDGIKTRFYLNPILRSNLGPGTSFEFEFQNIVQNDLPGKAISAPIQITLNQSFRFSDTSFLVTSLGYLPQNKFGLNLAYRNYLDSEKFYLELLFGINRLGYLNEDLVIVNNRNSDAYWQANVNYRWNKFDTDFNLTYGTFYAGDLGYKLNITRQLHEVYFSLFYARTDVASSGSFGYSQKGISGFAIQIPFGQSKYMKPKKIRTRSNDYFNILYRYSGFSSSGIDINQGNNLLSDIREFYPEVLRKGVFKFLMGK